jgi:hypothetical protein
MTTFGQLEITRRRITNTLTIARVCVFSYSHIHAHTLVRVAMRMFEMTQKLETRAEAVRRVRAEFDSYADTVLLTEPEAAAVDGFSAHTYKSWRLKKSTKGPQPVYLHGMVRYEVREIRRWRVQDDPGQRRPARTEVDDNSRDRSRLTKRPPRGSSQRPASKRTIESPQHQASSSG